jgi:hypothetical protein
VLRADGALVTERGVFSAGDRARPGSAALSDGTTFWFRAGEWNSRHLRELDGETGSKGRKSRPAWLEEAVLEGTELDVSASVLYPLPAGLSSPLGGKDGLYGFLRRFPDRRSEVQTNHPACHAERYDGLVHTADRDGFTTPTALLDIPGRDTALCVDERHGGGSLREADGTRTSDLSNDYRRGWPIGLPIAAWHYLTPRDEPGSAALRDLSHDVAVALLEAGHAAVGEAEMSRGGYTFTFEDTPLETATRAAVPEVTHPRLLRGLGGLAFFAGTKLEALRALLANTEGGATHSIASAPPDPEGMWDLMANLRGQAPYGESRGIAELTLWSALLPTLEDGTLVPIADSGELVWHPLLLRSGALAFRAAVGQPAARALLDAIAGSAFADLAPQMRSYRLFSRDIGIALPGNNRAFALRRGQNTVFARQHNWNGWVVLEHAPDGQFVQLDGEMTFEVRGDEASIAAIAAAPAPTMPSDPARLAEATGLTLDEASLLLQGVTQASTLKKAAHARAEAGLALTDAKVTDLLHDAWVHHVQTGAELDLSLAAAWNATLGKRPPIAADTASGLAADLRLDDPIGLLRTLHVVPHDPVVRLNADGKGYHLGAGELNPVHIRGWLAMISWLQGFVPVGDPSRQAIPAGAEAMRHQTLHPDMRVALGHYVDRDAVVKVIGDTPIRHPDGTPVEHSTHGRDLYFFGRGWGKLYVAPRKLLDGIDEIGAILNTGYDWARNLRGFLQGDWQALIDRTANTPVPEGGVEANPLLSAPQTVAAVAAATGLSEDGAVYYLQLLALAWPKDASVRKWNGWSPKRFKAARAEVAATEHVVEAKRARAGRSLFLPGGWEALKSPRPPIETWKLPLYDLTLRDGDVRGPLDHVYASAPLHTRFEAAWARIQAGDVPRFEEPGA